LISETALQALYEGNENEFQNRRLDSLNEMEKGFFAILAERYENKLGPL
jgi:hypothetical protein